MCVARVAKCWAGAGPNGEARWVPCEPAMQDAKPNKKIAFDLDAVEGICVTYKGQRLEISADEIWEVLTSLSKWRLRAL